MNTNKYTEYLFEIMQDHYENNKSTYRDESKEWQKTNRMNEKILKIVKDYFINKKMKGETR
jgi:hypothetical protein|tara:strand:- start:857 stop:1039 length:183 start_codon:yes stop_codon:yes gene_type:complete